VKSMHTLCSFVYFSLSPRLFVFQLCFKYAAFTFMLFILFNPPAPLNEKLGSK